MSVLSTHTFKRPFRHITASVMTVLYLAIIFSPLASAATHSTKGAAVAIRECSGDCNLCGCSPESRASNTCCCARKRQQQAHVHGTEDTDTPDCCKKEQGGSKETVIACGCPCGNGKTDTLPTSSSSEALPFHYAKQFNTPHTATPYFSLVHRLTSRHGEPPDPPPKLT